MLDFQYLTTEFVLAREQDQIRKGVLILGRLLVRTIKIRTLKVAGESLKLL
jgi:hypothetical protein